MISKEKEHRSFTLQEGGFEAAYTYVEKLLTRTDINEQTASETLLVFEALMQKLIDWGIDEDTVLDISGVDNLGNLSIRIGFEGKIFTPYTDSSDSIEDRLLKSHDDRLDFSYRSGYNVISITASRSYHTSFVACLIATIAAVLVYLPLRSMLDAPAQENLLDNYVFPLETLYTNAALMVGAPMTFFSLLKNLTDTYVISQHGSNMRRLQFKTLMTSVLAILLAFVAGFFMIAVFASVRGIDGEYSGSLVRSFSDVVTSLIPPSIFQPFESISPVPLMAVALLVTYALCSTGKYFDTLRQLMMAGYALFSRMLHVVLAALPIFCFIAVMDVLLDSGISGLLNITSYLVFICIALLLLFASYAIRLRAHGIKVIPFVQKLIPLIRENFKIGSAINATQYNIRYCSRTYNMNRRLLERNLPVLAQINLDGNCFIIVLYTLAFMNSTNTEVPVLSFVGIALLVLFLSFGAPNQPGSILIGTLIVTLYLHSYEVLCSVIYTEAFLGSVQNIVNVIGDIVMMAIEDKDEQAKLESEPQALGA